MKILLVGEYSGVHSELAKALNALGHEAVVCSDGDSYKGFTRDISISGPVIKSKLAIYLNIVKEYLGIRGLILYFKNSEKINRLKNYDVVQIINPVALECFGSIANILLIRKLSKNNKKMYLCALGDDYEWVSGCINGKFKYSALDRLSTKTFHRYLFSLRYAYGLFFKTLHQTSVKLSDKIIPGLYDYKHVYLDNPKCVDVIPLPISLDKYSTPNKTTYPVKIFHGWQKGKELKKGNDIFAEAVLRLVNELGPDKVEYREVKSVPIDAYYKSYADADIFLDQCFSYDRGMNALLGMAAGKVVFSGFEPEAIKRRMSNIGINAIPNSDNVYDELKKLILDTELIDVIKNRAYSYAREEHEAHKVASEYLFVWANPSSA
jgi:hypothetical protein